MADDNEDQGLLSLTTEIVASFVGNNPVAIGDLPAVIASRVWHLAQRDPGRGGEACGSTGAGSADQEIDRDGLS